MNEANESTCGPTCGRKPHTPLRQGRELVGGWQGTEPRALRSAGVGSVGAAADHLRFFTSNDSRPVAATINTTMMLQGVDEVGCSLTAADFTISLLLMSKGLF